MLRTLMLGGGDDAGGQMGDAHGGLHLVHVLAALAAGTVGVNFQFTGRNDDFRIVLFNFGNHVHAGETGVTPLVRVEGRDAHQAVHAAFGLGKAVGVFAAEDHGDAFEDGAFTGEDV